MDTFKTKPGIPEEILITEENFANETGRQFPYAMKKNEKITYKAVCPIRQLKFKIIVTGWIDFSDRILYYI